MYYLVERIDAKMARLIGFISVTVFEVIPGSVKDGETRRAGENGYDFTSRVDTLVCEPEDLWLSYRED